MKENQPTIKIFLPLIIIIICSSVRGGNPENDASTGFLNIDCPSTLTKAPKQNIWPDTLLYNSGDTVKKIYGKNIERSDAFYDSLKAIAYKRKWTAILYNLTVKSNSESVHLEPIISTNDLPYNTFKGKVINKIEIIRLKPFDTLQPTKFKKILAETGNSLHIMTRRMVIKKNLLVKQGDKLDPVVISDNERLLRDLPFIDEANIQIIETSSGSDSVDLIVVTKDKFDIAFNPVIKSYDKFSFKIWSVNFLGLGHRIENNISYDGKRDPPLYYEEGKYEVSNIGGSFAKGMVQYKRNDQDRREYILGVNRAFIPPTFNNAYGTKFTYVTYPAGISVADTLFQILDIRYSVFDGYYSYGFALPGKNISNLHPAYVLLSGRIINTSYYSRPYISADSNLGFRERTMIIGGISLVKNNYFITKYVYGFGETEDIPYGFTIQINGGQEFGEYYNRPYSGLVIGYGNYFNRFGYIYSRANLGTYFKNSSPEQGVADFMIRYASPLANLGGGRLRNYLGISLTYGFNRLPGEEILLSDQYGMEGLSNNLLRGQKRFITGWETTYYTPWYIYGFSIAIYGFVDIGILAPTDISFLKSKAYSGIGLGVRIKNENLVFNTFQLQLSYFPKPPAGANNIDLSTSSIPDMNLNNFYVTSPTIPSFY